MYYGEDKLAPSPGAPAPASSHYIQPKEKADVAEKARATNGARVYGAVLIVLGFAMFGGAVPFLSDMENYGNIRTGLEASGTDFAKELVLPFYMIAGGPLAIVAGGLGLASYYTNKRVVGYISMVVALAAAALPIYAAVRVNTIIDDTIKKLEGNPVTDEFSSSEKKLLDFISVVFNECCLTEYDSRAYKDGFGQLRDDENNPVDDNQRPVRICTNDIDTTCPLTGPNKIFPDLIDQAVDIINSPLDQVLCACFQSQEQYDIINTSVQENDLCTKYRKIIVEKADDRPVPTTKLTFASLIVALKLIRPQYTVPIGRFAMVGKILPKESVYGEPEEDIGYSCGLGYAKGMGYQMSLYIQDGVKGIRITALALGSMYAILPVVLALYWLSGGGENEEGDFVAYDEYNQGGYPPAAQGQRDINV